VYLQMHLNEEDISTGRILCKLHLFLMIRRGMLRDRVPSCLVTKSQLSPAMADEACKVDGWRQGYDEEMGAKTIPFL